MVRAAVLGSPVAHSLSPTLHRAGFDFLGVEGESKAIECDGVSGISVATALESLDFASVTMPLKERLYEVCDVLDEPAVRAKAINTMRRVDGRWQGRNVDGAGFVRAAIDDLDVDFRNARVTMFGAGAAARSVLDAVLQEGVDSVAVVTRRPVDATGWPMLSDSRVTLTQQATTSSDVVINATPVSLTGGVTLPKVPAYDYTAFLDLVYVPAETPWMQEMREVSTRVANGLGMLLWQAKLQLDWWFNADVPISVLKAAVA